MTLNELVELFDREDLNPNKELIFHVEPTDDFIIDDMCNDCNYISVYLKGR